MSSFIIRDVRIFTGEQVIQDGFVYVVDGKIRSVGPSSDTPQESGKVYSKPGCTLLPGLIDCHVHVGAGSDHALSQALRFGVTTVCEMQSELPYVLARKKQTLEPDTASYKTAGQAATIENGWPIPVITAHDKSPETLADIATWPKLTTLESVIDYLEWTTREMQPDYIKLMHESGTSLGMPLIKPTTQLQKHIVEEAKKRGYLTVAHAMCLQDTLEVLEAGVDGLMHTICDQPPTQELVDAYKRNNAFLNPTLAAMGSLTTEGAELQKKFAHDPRIQHLLSENDVEHICRCMAMAKKDAKVQYAYDSVRMLRKAGIDILCGSDTAGPAIGTAFGITTHHELSLFVKEIGMSPEEALRSATSKVAERFRFTDRGRLAEGLNADLLLVEGNPLENIDATLNIKGVWREGNICSVYASAVEA